MRSLVIAALCLLAAQANAWDMSEGIECVSRSFGAAMNASFQDMISRMDNMSNHKNDIMEKMEIQLNEIRERFSLNLEKALEEQRANGDDCTEGNLAARIACQVKRRFGLAATGAKVAGKSMGEALSMLKEHAKDFSGSRLTGLGQIISSVRQGLPALLQAATKCFSNSE